MNIAVGAVIAGINMYNISLKKNRGQWDDTRYAVIAGFKGYVYGVFWPFSIGTILADSFHSEKEFKRHFIPLSVYGNARDKESVEK